MLLKLYCNDSFESKYTLASSYCQKFNVFVFRNCLIFSVTLVFWKLENIL